MLFTLDIVINIYGRDRYGYNIALLAYTFGRVSDEKVSTLKRLRDHCSYVFYDQQSRTIRYYCGVRKEK